MLEALRGNRSRSSREDTPGLPLPARAEIAFEGEPFGTTERRKAPLVSGQGTTQAPDREEPVIRVKTVYHRNDPILTCSRPSRPPSDYSFSKGVVKSAMIWEELEKCGVPNVKGVWCTKQAWPAFQHCLDQQAYPGTFATGWTDQRLRPMQADT